MALYGYSVRASVDDFTKPTNDSVCTTKTYQIWSRNCFSAIHKILEQIITDYDNCDDCWIFVHVMAEDTELGVIDDRLIRCVNNYHSH